MAYFVFVEGGKAPKREHETFELAYCEACRLSSMGDNVNKKVYVLKVETVFKSEIVVKDETGRPVDTEILADIQPTLKQR